MSKRNRLIYTVHGTYEGIIGASTSAVRAVACAEQFINRHADDGLKEAVFDDDCGGDMPYDRKRLTRLVRERGFGCIRAEGVCADIITFAD